MVHAGCPLAVPTALRTKRSRGLDFSTRERQLVDIASWGMRRPQCPGWPVWAPSVLALVAVAGLFFMHGVTSMHEVLTPRASAARAVSSVHGTSAPEEPDGRWLRATAANAHEGAVGHRAGSYPLHGAPHHTATCLGVLAALLLLGLTSLSKWPGDRPGGDPQTSFVILRRRRPPPLLSSSPVVLGIART